MKIKNKNILITQSRLVDFTGSEIITLEIAEYFSGKGANVTILTSVLDKPIKKYFDNLKNVKIITGLTSDKVNRLFLEKSLDLVWVHHQIIPLPLLAKKVLSETRVIFNHMSFYYNYEFPIFDKIEEEIADYILFNSPETQAEIIKTGALDNIKGKKKVIGNAAPKNFFVKNISRGKPKLENVLVISNHIPDELRKAIGILRSRGVVVNIAGVSNKNEDTYTRITPDIIAGYDAIITIGKSVQYALVGSVPVYCYDHFGGPGFINSSNVEQAMHSNFSGRGFEKKAPTTIVKEIMKFSEINISDALSLKEKYSKYFNLEEILDSIIDDLKEGTTTDKNSIKPGDVAAYSKFYSVMNDLLCFQLNNSQQLLALEKELIELHAIYNKQLEDYQVIKANNLRLSSENIELSAAIERIINSKSYKMAEKIHKVYKIIQTTKPGGNK